MVRLALSGLSKWARLTLIMIVLASFFVIAGSLNITESQITFQGEAGNTLTNTFTIENQGNTTLNGINFTVTNLVSGANTIQSNLVIVNNGQTLNLAVSSGPQNIPISISVLSGTPEGSYVGFLSAASGGEVSQLVPLIVNVLPSDNQAPIITSHGPHGVIHSSSIVLSVITNENAICRYSTQSNIPYDIMTHTFSTTGGTVHEETIGGLVNSGHNYYVRCADTLGNKATTDYHISFTIEHLPHATITLSDTSPIRAGTIEVNLELSESISGSPTLQYSIAGRGVENIPLEGSGAEWTGLMVIAEGTGTHVGNFILTATALGGETISEIREGGIFLVDTDKPKQVGSFSVESPNADYVTLEWYFEEQDASFNIYRDVVPGVDLTDYYTTTQEDKFFDEDIDPGITYYYRIAAVDAAGNIGDLSVEFSSTALLSQPGTNTNLNPTFLSEVDKLLSDIINLRSDLGHIDGELNNEEKRFFDILSLNGLIKGKIEELNAMQSRVNEFKTQNLDKAELDKKIKREELALKTIEQQVPAHVTTEGIVRFTQTLDDEFLVSFINDFYEAKEDSDKRKIYRKNKKDYNKIKVDTIVTGLNIVYLDGSEKEMALVERNIQQTEVIANISIIEYIPKEVIRSTEDMTFYTTGYTILEEDPILEWRDTETIYSVEELGNLERFRLSKVFLFHKEEVTIEESGITGFSVFNPLAGNTIGLAILLIILGGFGLYYFLHIKEDENHLHLLSPLRKDVRKVHEEIDNKKLEESKNGYRRLLQQTQHFGKRQQKRHSLALQELGHRINGLEFKTYCALLKTALESNQEEDINQRHQVLLQIYDHLPQHSQSFFAPEMRQIQEEIARYYGTVSAS